MLRNLKKKLMEESKMSIAPSECLSASAALNSEPKLEVSTIPLKEGNSRKVDDKLILHQTATEQEKLNAERNGDIRSESENEYCSGTIDKGISNMKKKKSVIDALSESMVDVKLNSKGMSPEKKSPEENEIKKRGRGRPRKSESAKKVKLSQFEKVEHTEKIMNHSESSPSTRKLKAESNVLMKKRLFEPCEYLPEESDTIYKSKCTASPRKTFTKAMNKYSELIEIFNQDSMDKSPNHIENISFNKYSPNQPRVDCSKSKTQYVNEQFTADTNHQQTKMLCKSPSSSRKVDQIVPEDVEDLIPGDLIPCDMEVGYILAPSRFNKNPLVFQSKVDAGMYSEEVTGKDIYVYIFKEILPGASKEEPFLVYVELPNKDLQLLKNDDEKPVRFDMNEEDDEAKYSKHSSPCRQEADSQMIPSENIKIKEYSENNSNTINDMLATPPRANQDDTCEKDSCNDKFVDYVLLERVQSTPVDEHNNDSRISGIQVNWLEYCLENFNSYPEVLYSDMQPQVVLEVTGVPELSESAIELLKSCDNTVPGRSVWRSHYREGDPEHCTRTAGLYKMSDSSSTLSLNQEVVNIPDYCGNLSSKSLDPSNTLSFIPLCKSEESLLSCDDEQVLYPKRKTSIDFAEKFIPPKSPCYPKDVDARHDTQIESQAWKKLMEQHKYKRSENNCNVNTHQKKAELISFIMPPKRALSRPHSKCSKRRKMTIANKEIGKIKVRFLHPPRIIRVEIKTFKKTDHICAIRLWQHYDKYGPGGECTECNAVIPSDLALEQHILYCKTVKCKNKCNTCWAKFSSLKLLKNHAKVCGVNKKDIELYYCMACNTNLTSKSGFVLHTRNLRHVDIVKKEERIFEESSQLFTGTSVCATEDQSSDSLGGMVLIEVEEEDYFEEEEQITKTVEGPVRMRAIEKNVRTLRVYKYQTALMTNLMKVSEWRKQLDKKFEEHQNGLKKKTSECNSKVNEDQPRESGSKPFEEYVDVISDNWSCEKKKFSEGQKMDLRGKLSKKTQFAGRIVDLRRKYRIFKSPPPILYKKIQNLAAKKGTRKCPSPYHPHPLAFYPEELNKLDHTSEEENKDGKVLYNLDEKIVVPHYLYDKRRRHKYIDLDKPSEYYTFIIDDSGNFIMEKGKIDNPLSGINTNNVPNFGNNEDSEEFFNFLQETSDILQDNRYMFTGASNKNREYVKNFINMEASSEYVPQGETYGNDYTPQGMTIMPSVSGQILPRDLHTPPRNSNMVGNNEDGNYVESGNNLADFTSMPQSPSGYDKCFEDLWNTGL